MEPSVDASKEALALAALGLASHGENRPKDGSPRLPPQASWPTGQVNRHASLSPATAAMRINQVLAAAPTQGLIPSGLTPLLPPLLHSIFFLLFPPPTAARRPGHFGLSSPLCQSRCGLKTRPLPKQDISFLAALLSAFKCCPFLPRVTSLRLQGVPRTVMPPPSLPPSS